MSIRAYRFIDSTNAVSIIIAAIIGMAILYFISRKRYKFGYTKNFFTGEFKKTYQGLEICFRKWNHSSEAFSNSVGLHGSIRLTDTSKDLSKLSSLFDTFDTEETQGGSITFFKINKFDFSSSGVESFIAKIDGSINQL